MPQSNPATILAVDDNEAVRYSVTRCLRDAGYQIMEACTGEEALQAARQCPDLITLDINLPDLSGFEVCRRLKDDPATCDIPVVQISATFVGLEDRVRGLQGGADAFLPEPIDRRELLATVGALVRVSQAQKEARRQASEAQAAREQLKKTNESLEQRVRERTAQLEKRSAEVEELSRRLLNAQDDERRRVSRELHDSTGQLLVGLSLNLARLSTEFQPNDPLTKALILDTTSIAEEISRQIRTLSYLLHPPLLDEAGLASALKWYVDGYVNRSNIKVSLELAPDLGRMPQDLETTIFRLVQESLTNIHRHADSKTAIIRLTRDERQVHLQINDQGNGIADPGYRRNGRFRPGVGILGMKERVMQFGGTFEISSDTAGTSVRATLPLTEPGSSQSNKPRN